MGELQELGHRTNDGPILGTIETFRKNVTYLLFLTGVAPVTYQCHHQVIHCVYTTHIGTLGHVPGTRRTYWLPKGECSPARWNTAATASALPTLSPRSAWKPSP